MSHTNRPKRQSSYGDQPPESDFYVMAFDSTKVGVGDTLVLEEDGCDTKLVTVTKRSDKRIWIGHQKFMLDGTECYGGGGILFIPTTDEEAALRRATKEAFSFTPSFHVTKIRTRKLRS